MNRNLTLPFGIWAITYLILSNPTFSQSSESIATDSVSQLIHQAEEYRLDEKFEQAESLLTKALDLSIVQKNDSLLAQVYFHLGLVYDYSMQPDLALKNHFRALEIRNQSGSDGSLLAVSYKAIGDVYNYVLESGFEAENYYLHAKRIWNDNNQKINENTAEIHHSLASANRVKGDFELALDYIDTAIYFWSNLGSQYAGRLFNSQIVKANIYNSSTQYDSAIKHYDLAIASIKDSEESAKAAYYFTNIATCYDEQKKYDSAIFFYHQSLKISRAIDRPDMISNVYFGLGETYTNIDSEDSARYYLLRCLDIRRNFYKEHHTQTALIYKELAKYYQKYQKFDSAFLYIQKSLGSLFKDFNSQGDIFTNPKLEDLTNNQTVFITLAEKGNIMLDFYQQTNANVEYLDLAWETFSLAMEGFTINRKSFQEEGSQLISLDHYHYILEGVIRCLYMLYEQIPEQHYISQAYQFMEMGKAVLLMESLNRASVKSNVGLPDSLMALERQLKTQMVLAKQTKDSTTIDSLLVAQGNLKKWIARELPQYYQIAYATQHADITDLQKKLESHEMVIEYFWGDNSVYALSITESEIGFVQLENNKLLAKQYATEVRKPQAFTKVQEQFDRYCTLALEVYQKYIAPLNLQNNTDIQRLTIIPDGPLLFIPFEAILTNRPSNNKVNYQQLNYLIREFEINYAYSAQWLLRTHDQQEKLINPKVTAFAYADANDAELPGTNEEIQAVEVSFPGEFFYGTQASKSNFLAHAQESNIIHLAIHGQADTTNRKGSILIFHSPKGYDTLNVVEIYNWRPRNDITILTACESGIGTLQRGEGVYSIGRAFAYNGSNSIMMSQWKIDDKSTAKLVKYFYQNLKGYSVSQAMYQAKLNYLNATDDDELSAHPSNWAGLIVLGNTKVSLHGYWFYLLFWGSIAIIFIYFVIITKNRFKNQPKIKPKV